jgi:hypothetical protein
LGANKSAEPAAAAAAAMAMVGLQLPINSTPPQPPASDYTPSGCSINKIGSNSSSKQDMLPWTHYMSSTPLFHPSFCLFIFFFISLFFDLFTFKFVYSVFLMKRNYSFKPELQVIQVSVYSYPPQMIVGAVSAWPTHIIPMQNLRNQRTRTKVDPESNTGA